MNKIYFSWLLLYQRGPRFFLALTVSVEAIEELFKLGVRFLNQDSFFSPCCEASGPPVALLIFILRRLIIKIHNNNL